AIGRRHGTMHRDAVLDVAAEIVRPTAAGPDVLSDETVDCGAITEVVVPSQVGNDERRTILETVVLQPRGRGGSQADRAARLAGIQKLKLGLDAEVADPAWIPRPAEIEVGVVAPCGDGQSARSVAVACLQDGLIR